MPRGWACRFSSPDAIRHVSSSRRAACHGARSAPTRWRLLADEVSERKFWPHGFRGGVGGESIEALKLFSVIGLTPGCHFPRLEISRLSHPNNHPDHGVSA